MQQEEQTERIIYLISKAANGTVSADEFRELEEWKTSSSANRQLYGQLLDSGYRKQQLQNWDNQATEHQLVMLNRRMDGYQRGRRFNYGIAAAIVAALVAISTYFFVWKKEQQQIYTGEGIYQVASNIKPREDKATLTLANGQIIDLGNARHGTIAQQNGTNITKTADGQLVYEHTYTNEHTDAYNTIQTPKGGLYTLRLPDGTKVWLNTATNFRYKADMSRTAQRVVELDGEAYFQVAPNKAKPFVVKTAKQQIEVLGTHFNVSSYRDDPQTSTTLVEGSVLVSTAQEQKLLKSKQRATTETNKLKIEQADTELATAWKDGRLQFREVPLKDMMRLVARWYNIDVKYEGNVPNDTFTGNLPKGSSLSVMLKILASSHINFELRQKENNCTLVLKP
jgi:transmembrane sensor